MKAHYPAYYTSAHQIHEHEKFKFTLFNKFTCILSKKKSPLQQTIDLAAILKLEQHYSNINRDFHYNR